MNSFTMGGDTSIAIGVKNEGWEVAATLWLVRMWWMCGAVEIDVLRFIVALHENEAVG